MFDCIMLVHHIYFMVSFKKLDGKCMILKNFSSLKVSYASKYCVITVRVQCTDITICKSWLGNISTGETSSTVKKFICLYIHTLYRCHY